MLLLHKFYVRLIGLGVAFIHENAAVFLVAQSHDTTFIIYYVEEFVNNFLVFDLDGSISIQCLFSLNQKTHLAFVLGMIVLGLRLLELDAVDLIHKALLHFWWHRHVHMYDISILLSELIMFHSLVVVRY